MPTNIELLYPESLYPELYGKDYMSFLLKYDSAFTDANRAKIEKYLTSLGDDVVYWHYERLDAYVNFILNVNFDKMEELTPKLINIGNALELKDWNKHFVPENYDKIEEYINGYDKYFTKHGYYTAGKYVDFIFSGSFQNLNNFAPNLIHPVFSKYLNNWSKLFVLKKSDLIRKYINGIDISYYLTDDPHQMKELNTYINMVLNTYPIGIEKYFDMYEKNIRLSR